MTETLNTLVEQIQHPEKSVRSHAVFSLSKLNDIDATLPVLLAALVHEPDVMVREDITWTLVRAKDAALLPLIDLLRDENPAARHHAAHVLGKIADARAVDGLISVLQDTEPMVVSKATFALRQIGDVQAVPAIVRLVGHADRDVQSMVASVLEHFATEALPLLIAKMTDANWQVREHAADILGMIGNRQAVPVLVPALQDASWQVRFAVVTALGHIGGAVARKALESVQNDADARVKSLVPEVMKRMRR